MALVLNSKKVPVILYKSWLINYRVLGQKIHPDEFRKADCQIPRTNLRNSLRRQSYRNALVNFLKGGIQKLHGQDFRYFLSCGSIVFEWSPWVFMYHGLYRI